ncbi:MAG: bifunctional DNA primase/polymerase [Myxococcales bacterium]|nr:bifunctional DNA primase/polymerase [Myxococcales bacterium]
MTIDNSAVLTAAHGLIDLGLGVCLADRHAAPDRAKAPLDLTLGYPRTGGWNVHARDHQTLDAWAATAPRCGITLNAGVALGPDSPIMVVDLDNSRSIREWDALRPEGAPRLGLTTRSPGRKNPDGSWNPRHRDGGHVWLRHTARSRSADLPGGTKITSAPDEYEVDFKVRGFWVMAPPSVRAEGPYSWVQDPRTDLAEVPDWLVDRLLEAAPKRRKRTPAAIATGDAAVAAWSADMPWSDVLGEAGWTDSGSTAACGCPVWSRPGGASPRSGVAHEPGCSRWDGSADPPLHLLTTGDSTVLGDMAASLGRQTISKLEAVAAVYYEGDVSLAFRREGIAPRVSVVSATAFGAGTATRSASPHTFIVPPPGGTPGPGLPKPSEPEPVVAPVAPPAPAPVAATTREEIDMDYDSGAREGYWATALARFGIAHEPGTEQVVSDRLHWGGESRPAHFTPTFWLPGLRLWAHVVPPGTADTPAAMWTLLHAVAHLSSDGGSGCHDLGGHDVILLGSPLIAWRVHMHKGILAALPWPVDSRPDSHLCALHDRACEYLEVAQDYGEITEDARIVLAA